MLTIGLAGLVLFVGVATGWLYAWATLWCWRATRRLTDLLTMILVVVTSLVFGLAGITVWLVITPVASLPHLGYWLSPASLLLDMALLCVFGPLMHAIAQP